MGKLMSGTYTSIGPPPASVVVPKVEVEVPDNADVCEALADLGFATSHGLTAINETLAKLCVTLEALLQAQSRQETPNVNVMAAAPVVNVAAAIPEIRVEAAAPCIHVAPKGPDVVVEPHHNIDVDHAVPIWSIIALLVMIAAIIALMSVPIVSGL